MGKAIDDFTHSKPPYIIYPSSEIPPEASAAALLAGTGQRCVYHIVQ